MTIAARALVLGVVVLVASACTVTSKIQVGGWIATCSGVSVPDCEGMAAVFIGNLVRDAEAVRRASGA